MTACERARECNPDEMLRLRDRIYEIADDVHAIKLDVTVMQQQATERTAWQVELTRRLFGDDDNGDRGVLNRHASRISRLERWRTQVTAGAAAVAALGAAAAWARDILGAATMWIFGARN